MVRARSVLTSGLLSVLLFGCNASDEAPAWVISPAVGAPDENDDDDDDNDAGVADAGDSEGESDAALPEPQVPVPGPGDAGVDSGPGDSGAPDAGAIEPDESLAPTFTNVYELLQSRCRLCHGSPGAHGINLSSREAAYRDFVTGPKESLAPSLCSNQGHTLVIPNNPDGSLLMQKLDNTQTCGDMMPTSQFMMPKFYRDMVRAWIAAGAKND